MQSKETLALFVLFVALYCDVASAMCTREYRPVCADNGKVYSNACTAEADGQVGVKKNHVFSVSSHANVAKAKCTNLVALQSTCICQRKIFQHRFQLLNQSFVKRFPSVSCRCPSPIPRSAAVRRRKRGVSKRARNKEHHLYNKGVHVSC